MDMPWWVIDGLFRSAGTVGQVRCVYENMGDILVHRAIDHLMNGTRIVVYDKNSRMMRLVDSVVGLRRVLRYGMLGGGTLIFSPRNVGWLGSLEHLLARTEPLCCFGTGVADPEFWSRTFKATGHSPLDASIEGWLNVLRRFPMIGVRGVESERILRAWGIGGVEVIGDPAVAFARDKVTPKERRKRIGVNILNESHFWLGSKEHAIREMGKFVRNLTRDGWEVHLMPACEKDLVLATEIATALGRDKLHILSVFRQVEDYFEAVGRMDLFVGMRLHSYIAACCTHTPGIMVGYQPKCLDFTKTMGLEHQHIPTDQVDADDLMGFVAEQYASLDALQQDVAEKCSLMKRRLVAFAGRVANRLASQV